MICADCGKNYDVNGKFTPAFCEDCCFIHKKDIVEIITLDGFVQYQNAYDAEKALSEFSANVRLDLHNVLDTIHVNKKLKYMQEDCCCISFVGQITQIRIQARNEIIARIKSGQISFGALVFKRGNRRNPVKGHTFTEVGSKAWFNQHVTYTWDKMVPIFADDSDDHVDSVQYLLPHINCILINNDKQCRHLFVQ